MARAVLKGISLSPGIAIGPLLLLPDTRIHDRRKITESEITAEICALKAASQSACERLGKTIANIPENLRECREIVALQLELARDSRILEGAMARIRHKKICAAWALAETISELGALFEGMADPYLSDRAQDIRTIGGRLLAELAGNADCVSEDEPRIVAAYDLSPVSIMEACPQRILGLLTIEGGVTSHTAILARGMKVPCLGGVTGLFREARNGETVILDGLAGEALISPDEAEIEAYARRRDRHATFETEARQTALSPAITLDGREMEILANMENRSEMHELGRCGATGIGLYRTEFGWLAGGSDEEALYQEYAAVLAAAKGRKVIFRTLDTGADKILPAAEALHEPNPALGLRGIRFCLSRKHIFRPQLRALLRAGVKGNMEIMLPLVTGIQEVRETRELIAEVAGELAKEGVEHIADPSLGVMLETPAAVFICQELAAECDFISLGTNDLLHYIMAIDRNNRHVSYLHEPLHPAFMRAIQSVAEACHANGKKVSVCGELAADPAGIALLLGLGVDALSATPRFVPAIKHIIRKLSYQKCREIAASAVRGEPVSATRAQLREILTECVNQTGMYSQLQGQP